jgi:transketolase
MKGLKKSDNLEHTARHIRGELVKISNKANTPHLGSSLSCVEILVAAYWGVLNIDPQKPDAPDRDRLIFSKGHAATTLYLTLNMKGLMSNETLATYAKPGGILPEHPIYRSAPGIEATSGSLGHGLPLGLGIAVAARIHKIDYRVYVVMSDGECNEGSVWEAAMLAPAQGLENLAVIVDCNQWQATGRSKDITGISSLKGKFEAFGWSSCDIDGHDVNALVEVLQKVPDGSGKPVAVIAHTIKGKGVSFMEDDNNWHYRIPNEEEVKKALTEMGLL